MGLRTIRVTTGDARSLDYGSYGSKNPNIKALGPKTIQIVVFRT